MNRLPELPAPLLFAVVAACIASLSGMAWALKASPVMMPVKPLEIVRRMPVEPPTPRSGDATTSNRSQPRSNFIAAR